MSNALTKMILHTASKLPPFPRVAQKCLELLQDPEVTVDSLVEVVQMDPALTANVLKAVNSPLYGLLQKVDNLAQALPLLGNKTFSEVVFTSASAKLLGDKQAGYDMDKGDLWQHCLATALMTQVIGDHVDRKPSSVLYTAALLHDLGKVVMSSYVENRYQLIIEDVKKGADFLNAEREVFGLDHAELGSRMASDWHFSEEMINLIKFHHNPEKMPKDKDLAILYTANVACQMMGMGGGADGVSGEWNEDAMALIGFKQKDLDLVMIELVVRLDNATAMLSIGNR